MKYLIYSSEAAALARNQSEAISRGCDGIQTMSWWRCRQTAQGTWALCVPDDDPVPELPPILTTTEPEWPAAQEPI